MTSKAYLKSCHLPREIENPEDVDGGRKMVYVEEVAFGETKAPGLGGLVFLEQPGEPQLAMVRGFAGFELGGSINVALIDEMSVTWSYGEGKVWLAKP